MRIGIDLGGTKIEGVALGGRGEEIARHRRPTPNNDYDATIAAVVDVVETLERQAGIQGTIGVAMPGAISPATGLIKNANSICLNGKPFDRDLRAALGRDVRLANDANCFALSEAVDGAGQGFSTVFGVIAGTGVGGGIVMGQEVLTGPHAIAGEWGHNPLPWPGETEWQTSPTCYCGKRGCIETWISGPGVAADHERTSGQKLTAEEIASASEDGDPAARATVSRLVERFAKSLATIINIIDPDVIVLGGGLSNIDALYDLVPARLSDFVFSDRIDVTVVRNQHGDSSGVRGAAWLWPEDGP